MNELKIITLYYYICECYTTELGWHCQRFTNNSVPKFTDEELLTIYLYSVIEEEKYKVKSIWNYARKYLQSWFPDLPSYQAFNNRLNRLAPVFPLLVSRLLADANHEEIRERISLLDSLPIMTCSDKRAGKVAPQLTNKGYCATKKQHYYGVKLHSIAFQRKGKLPFPEYLCISPASEHDLTAVRPILPKLKNRDLFADKIYFDGPLNEYLQQEINSLIYTPVKLVKGDTMEMRQYKHAADALYSYAVSQVRQPIESFFNWIIEKTDIQRASKVRSRNGLIVHVFGKIAAAISLWVF